MQTLPSLHHSAFVHAKILGFVASVLMPFVTQGQIILNTAGTYDGSQSSVNSSAINLQDDFSITFWFKTTETSDRDFWQLQGQGPGNDALSLRLDEMTVAPNAGEWFPESDASPIWSRFRESDYTSTAIFNAADDNWHQLTYVYDYDGAGGDGIATLYIDGSSLASKGPDVFADTTGVFSMFSGGKSPFVGEFSDTAVYTSALTAQEVSDLFNAGPGTVVIPEPSTAGLLALGLMSLLALQRRRHGRV